MNRYDYALRFVAVFTVLVGVGVFFVGILFNVGLWGFFTGAAAGTCIVEGFRQFRANVKLVRGDK